MGLTPRNIIALKNATGFEQVAHSADLGDCTPLAVDSVERALCFIVGKGIDKEPASGGVQGKVAWAFDDIVQLAFDLSGVGVDPDDPAVGGTIVGIFNIENVSIIDIPYGVPGNTTTVVNHFSASEVHGEKGIEGAPSPVGVLRLHQLEKESVPISVGYGVIEEGCFPAPVFAGEEASAGIYMDEVVEPPAVQVPCEDFPSGLLPVDTAEIGGTSVRRDGTAGTSCRALRHYTERRYGLPENRSRFPGIIDYSVTFERPLGKTACMVVGGKAAVENVVPPACQVQHSQGDGGCFIESVEK